MVGEIVEHARFGRGTVTVFDPPRMEIRFDSDGGEARRFSYPAAAARFIRFINPEAAQRAREDLENSDALARQEMLKQIEANRQREERISEERMESLRRKRSDAAKKAAERRRNVLAAKKAKTQA